MTDEQAKQMFLYGTGAVAVLAVVGLVWAIAAGPNTSYDGRARIESGLQFSDDNDPIRGPAEAKTVVRIFSDFQCPACRSAEEGLDYAMATYASSVKFVWNDFPLTTMHPNAQPAAEAARCAEAQGKFWEYRAHLFDRQPEWERQASLSGIFASYAKTLGLDEGAFTACVAAKTFASKVSADMAEGNTNSIRATPTFFIGNRRVEGAMSAQEWDAEIRKAMAAS
jgi:protein-disulfide isomerase